MAYYPIFVEMAGRRVLVIGGGNVAEGKVQGLLVAGADLTVVSPGLTPALAAQQDAGRFRWIERDYQPGDVGGYEVCFVATDDGAVNSAVAAEARERGIWVNAADDPPNCDFILPSVVRQGEVVVAASTGGASPALARRLREELSAFLAEDYAGLAETLKSVRGELRQRGIAVDAETWQAAIDARVRALLAQRRPEEARARLIENLGVAAGLGAPSDAGQ